MLIICFMKNLLKRSVKSTNWRTVLSWEEFQDEYLEDWQGFFTEEKYPSGDIFRYNRKGELHNTRGPAIIYGVGSVLYYQNGKPHRTDGPAYIGADGYEEYWVNGKRHRTDGPAKIFADGYEEYWVNDKRIAREQFYFRYGRHMQASVTLPKAEQYPDYETLDPQPVELLRNSPSTKKEDWDPIKYRNYTTDKSMIMEDGLHTTVNRPETDRPLTPYGGVEPRVGDTLRLSSWEEPTWVEYEEFWKRARAGQTWIMINKGGDMPGRDVYIYIVDVVPYYGKMSIKTSFDLESLRDSVYVNSSYNVYNNESSSYYYQLISG